MRQAADSGKSQVISVSQRLRVDNFASTAVAVLASILGTASAQALESQGRKSQSSDTHADDKSASDAHAIASANGANEHANTAGTPPEDHTSNAGLPADASAPVHSFDGVNSFDNANTDTAAQPDGADNALHVASPALASDGAFWFDGNAADDVAPPENVSIHDFSSEAHAVFTSANSSAFQYDTSSFAVTDLGATHLDHVSTSSEFGASANDSGMTPFASITNNGSAFNTFIFNEPTPEFTPPSTSNTPTLMWIGDIGSGPTTFTGASSSGGTSGSGSSSSAATSGHSTGLVINVVFDSSVANAPAGFTAAVDAVVSFYESEFTNPITITIDVGYGEIAGQALDAGALGESETYLMPVSYSSLETALVANANAIGNTAAAASLPATSPVSGQYWVPTAEAEALGLMSSSSTTVNGYMGFSSTLPFSYTDTSGVPSNEYDFFGTVAHEMSEIMGREMMDGENFGGGAAYEPLDLFHYSAPGVRDFSGTVAGYASANGTVNLGNFNTNPNGDFGDWASSVGNNSYLAFTGPGAVDAVTATDLQVMNLLGWQPATPTDPPPVVTIQLVQDTGKSSTDNITSNDALTGTADANATVTLKSGSTTLGTTTANTSGVWTFTPTGLANGQYTIVASETNSSGSTGTASLTFTLDTTAPTVASDVASGTGITNGAGSVTAGQTVLLTLTMSEAVTISGGTPSLTLNDGGTATYVAGSSTSTSLVFSYTVGATQSTNALAVTQFNVNGATITDVAGNAANMAGADTTFSNLQVVIPTPVVTMQLAHDTGTSSTDNITSNDALTGTADANAVVTLTSGSATLGTATANASGVWTFTPTGLTNGQYTIVASETNAGGKTGTASLTFTLDTTPPAVTSDVISGTGITNGSGTLMVGQTALLTLTMSEAVTISGGTPTLTLNDGGTATYVAASSTPTSLVFSYTIGATDSTSALAVTQFNANGATITDVAGNAANMTGADTTFSNLQVVIPTPVVTMQLAHDTGTSSTDNITSNDTLTGTADANATVTLTSGSTTLGTTTANSSGVWTFTPSGLANGQYTVVASETNAGGKTGTASLTFTLDTTAPTVTSDVASGTGITNGTGSVTQGQTVLLTLAMSEAVTISGGTPSLTLNDGGVATYVAASSTSTSLVFSYTVGSSQSTSALAVTQFNLNGATATDVAGNAANFAGADTTFSNLQVVLPPTPAVAVQLAHDTGTSSTDNITSNDALTGTADANAVVTLTSGSTTLGTATANSSGVWTFTPTGLANGQYTIVATETNSYGKTGTASLTFTLDTTAPTVTSDAASGSGITNGAGTVMVGQTVLLTLTMSEAVTISGGTPTLTLNDGGTATYVAASSTATSLVFSYTVGATDSTSALAVTQFNLNGATITDIAGNTANMAGADTTFSNLQVVIPTPTVTMQLAHDTGTSSSDHITSNDALTGTADANSVVTLTSGATTLGTTTANASGVWTFTPSGLANGQYTVVASETNAGGKTGTASLTFTLDTTAPTVTSDVASGTGITSGAGSVTQGQTVLLTLAMSEAVTISGGTPTLTLNDGGVATYVAASSTSTSLVFSYTVGSTQSTNALAVTQFNANGATITDVAGNAANMAGADTTFSGLQVVLPPTPAVTIALAHDTGSSSTDNITSNDALTGTADANATVTLTSGSTTLGTTTANSSGVWTFTPSGLANGQYTVVASETNSYGKTGTASANFTLDTTIPTVTSETASGTGITNGAGTVGAGQTVLLTLAMSEAVSISGGTPTLTLNDGGTATYVAASSTPTSLVFSYTVGVTDSTSALAVTQFNANGATITDVAGNAANMAGADTTFSNLQVVIPTPVVTMQLAHDTGASSTNNTNDSLAIIFTSNDTLTGTADPNAVVTLTSGTTTLGTATANSSGAWTFAPSGLADGQYTIVASETNAGGKTGTTSLTFTLDTQTPTVTSDVATGPGITNGVGTVVAGQTVLLTLTMNEGVTIANGTPTLTLNDGGTATYVAASSTSTSLVFSYTVGSSQSTSALAVTQFNSNGATITDVAGNVANMAGADTIFSGLQVVVPPTPVVTIELAHDTGASSTDNITSNDALTGTADPNAVVTLTSGTTTLGTTTANSSGIWTFAPSGLANGQYTVVASDTNSYGKTGIASLTFTLDATTPTVTSEAASGAGITNGAGAVGAGQTVLLTLAMSEAVSISGGTPTLTLNDGGTATYVAASSTPTSLVFSYTVGVTDSTNALAVTQFNANGATITDVAGNAANMAGADTTFSNLQVVIPTPVVTMQLAHDTGTSSTDNITSNDALIGTADANSTVTLKSGSTTLGTTTANSSGVWTFTPNGLGDGQYTVVASETNAGGKTGTASLTFTLDTQTPSVTSDAATGPGITNGAGSVVGGQTVLLTLTMSEGVTISGGTPTLTLNDGGVATYVAASSTATSLVFSYTVGPTQLTNALAVTQFNANGATITDIAGNVANMAGADTTFPNLQVVIPTPTVTMQLAQDTGASSADNVTSNDTLTGTADPNAVVTLTSGTTTLGTTTANSSGVWTFTPSGLANGQYTVVASETNAGGKIGAASLTFTLDTTTPTVTSDIIASTGITAEAGLLTASQIATLTLAMNEAVSVSGGTPTLTLNDGGTAIYDAAHSTPTSLVFDYTVGTGQYASALAVTGVNLNGASVTDLAGNVANLSGADTTFSQLSVDATTPVAVANEAHAMTLGSVSATHATGVLANDSDADPSDVLTVGAVNGLSSNVGHAVTGAFGTLTLNADGSYTYVNSNATAVTADGGVVIDTFNYTVSNGNGGTASTELNVLITSRGETYMTGASGSTVHGAIGTYVLDGSAGNVTVTAGLGTQWLIGAPGDTLNGSAGTDTFVFSNNVGHETVNNFSTANDAIEVPQSLFANFAAIQADMHTVGSNTVITIDANDSITLNNVNALTLHAQNFHIIA